MQKNSELWLLWFCSRLLSPRRRRAPKLKVKMLKAPKIVGVVALLATPAVVHAQGIFGGMEHGAAQGGAIAGPVGGIVGGAVGGAVGGVNGALGIHPRHHRHWAHEHRSAYYHRHYRHHYWHHHYRY